MNQTSNERVKGRAEKFGLAFYASASIQLMNLPTTAKAQIREQIYEMLKGYNTRISKTKEGVRLLMALPQDGGPSAEPKMQAELDDLLRRHSLGYLLDEYEVQRAIEDPISLSEDAAGSAGNDLYLFSILGISCDSAARLQIDLQVMPSAAENIARHTEWGSTLESFESYLNSNIISLALLEDLDSGKIIVTAGEAAIVLVPELASKGIEYAVIGAISKSSVDIRPKMSDDPFQLLEKSESVVIDLSNFRNDGDRHSRYEPCKDPMPMSRVRTLLSYRDRWKTHAPPEARCYFIADASLRHHVDDQIKLQELMDQRIVATAPAGTKADYYILRLADETGGVVVTSDNMRKNYSAEYPWLNDETRCIRFMRPTAEEKIMFSRATVLPANPINAKFRLRPRSRSPRTPWRADAPKESSGRMRTEAKLSPPRAEEVEEEKETKPSQPTRHERRSPPLPTITLAKPPFVTADIIATAQPASIQRFCRECGASVKTGDVFCVSCGAKTVYPSRTQQDKEPSLGSAQPDICPQCHCLNSTGVAFCSGCGFAMRQFPTPSANQIPPTPNLHDIAEGVGRWVERKVLDGVNSMFPPVRPNATSRYLCPTCRVYLILVSNGSFRTWTCPSCRNAWYG